MSRRYTILHSLSDGRFHSGADLAASLGISRTAVWKHLQALGELGIDIYAVPGKGYRLAAPLEILKRESILSAIPHPSRALLADLEIHPHLESTNTYLRAKAASDAPSGFACLAEYQSAGKGRRGRQWVSPFASNIYLSLLWRFPANPASISGLGLVSGVAISRALQQAGLKEPGLKWPNDVMWRGQKLAGTLLEMTGESFGPASVVIGIGLNVRMPPTAGTRIDQAWTDLESALGAEISRNVLAGTLLHHLLQAIQQFQARGLTPFIEEWQKHDMISGKTIQLQLPNEIITGVAQGIDHTGALLVNHKGIISSHMAGEVSVRL